MSLYSVSENKPLVSVVVPVYNGDKYFEKCLESIKNQTYTHWECIINNNCSTDQTLEVASRYANIDKRFKVYSNDSFVKMVTNWNIACSRVSNEAKYLKVLGADDWLFPESLEKMIEIMEKNPGVGLCSSYRLNDKRVDMDGLNLWDGNVHNGKHMLYDQLTKKIDISGSNSTVLFATAYIKKLPRYPKVFDDATYHQDTELVYDMMKISDVGFVFQVLSYTRRHEKAHTSTEGTRHKTLYQLKEKVLWLYKGNDPLLNKMYQSVRREYAYFLLTKTVAGNSKTVEWHRNYIVRKFRFEEYLYGVLFYNTLSRLLQKVYKRILH
ncbi:MAG TPA: glycosyltransferase family 2 protein [Bacteroidales bacterium]|nr:glycosyltransferase family 2 protein [Bacteroidales bacterium]